MRQQKAYSRFHTWLAAAFVALLAAGLAGVPSAAAQEGGPRTLPLVVLGYNDLGMHCMNDDFSEMMVLPPFNTLHAQVILRGEEPDIITSAEDYTVRYVLPRITHAADRSNFWKFPQSLLGPAPLPNLGLTGVGLAGTLAPTPQQDWAVVGIPIIPSDDTGRDNPYSLATITVTQGSTVMARTQAVVPVSTEMSCNICHNTPGMSTASDILADHDRLHGTTLSEQKPVLCASCHASNALGLPGTPGVPNLSNAMHGAHASRMEPVGYLIEECYACHPGIRTQCQRDLHFDAGLTCSGCHGGMESVGDPGRTPWVDEPRCSNCHTRPGFQFEQAGTLYRNSIGHGGVHCAACHGSPHAITATVTDADNVQAILLQGHAGVIDTCSVCHTTTPPEPFFHSVDN